MQPIGATLKFGNLQISAYLLTSLASFTVAAQDSTNASAYHPLMSNTFSLGVGVFRPTKNFEIRVDGTVPGPGTRLQRETATAGVNYQASDTFGLGLSYHSFKFDVDVKGSDFGGRFETSQAGPRVTLTAAW